MRNSILISFLHRTAFAVLFLMLTVLMNTEALPQDTYPKREMRGVWIATVGNIDYPSSRGKSTPEKISELKSMLRQMKASGMNTIFFQVRTECDALYNSSIEPWSYWFTGKQGQAPEPFFDPLQTAVDECHKLGMELHAWFNPYRAVKSVGGYETAPNHVSVTHPGWILTFKDYQMLDPGNPEAADYIVRVVDDVLQHYDVDGIHFDDYFYPYSPKVTNEDSLTFAKYPRGITNIDDWRRDNINSLMKDLYALINRKKPYVKFGISPFGIVENKYAGTNGFESYKILYCDPLNWIQNKIVDYVLPQLYWEMNHAKAPYSKLLPWWNSVTSPALLFIGHYSSSLLGNKYSGSPSELGDQIRMARSASATHGSVFFSAKSLMHNQKNFGDSLMYSFYLYPALQPLMPWKDSVAPKPPAEISLTVADGKEILRWKKPETAKDGGLPFTYAVYRFEQDEEINIENVRALRAIISAEEDSYSEFIPTGNRQFKFAVTSIDRLGNESTPSVAYPGTR